MSHVAGDGNGFYHDHGWLGGVGLQSFTRLNGEFPSVGVTLRPYLPEKKSTVGDSKYQLTIMFVYISGGRQGHYEDSVVRIILALKQKDVAPHWPDRVCARRQRNISHLEIEGDSRYQAGGLSMKAAGYENKSYEHKHQTLHKATRFLSHKRLENFLQMH